MKDKTKKNSESKDRGGLAVLQESDQRGEDAANEDPGVNSEDEEEEFKVIKSASQSFVEPSSF